VTHRISIWCLCVFLRRFYAARPNVRHIQIIHDPTIHQLWREEEQNKSTIATALWWLRRSSSPLPRPHHRQTWRRNETSCVPCSDPILLHCTVALSLISPPTHQNQTINLRSMIDWEKEKSEIHGAHHRSNNPAAPLLTWWTKMVQVDFMTLLPARPPLHSVTREVKRSVPVPVNPNRAATTAHARHASQGRAGTGLMLDGPRQRYGLGQPF